MAEPGAVTTGLTPRARDFVALVALLSALVGGAAVVFDLGGSSGFPTFLVLAAAASVTQLFAFAAKRNQVFHATPVFFLAGAILLAPEFLLLLPLVSHIADWIRHRYPWYIQTFNIANFTLAVMAASVTASVVADALPESEWPGRALAGLAGAGVYVLLNNAGFAVILRLARGHRMSDIFTRQILVSDLALASLGIAVAGAWLEVGWLIPFAIAPLVLLHQALRLPELQDEAREARHLRALAAVTDAATNAGDDALAGELLPSVVDGLKADAACLLLVDDERARLRQAATAGVARLPRDIVSSAGTVTAIVAGTRDAYVLGRQSEERVRRAAAASGLRSLAAVPLTDGETLVGVLHVAARRPHAFTDDDVEFLEVLAGRLARQLALARARRNLSSAYSVRDDALEASRTGVCVFSPDGVARFWNTAFVQLLGIDPDAGQGPLLTGIAGGARRPAPGEELRFWTADQRCLRIRVAQLESEEMLVSVDDLTGEVREKETRDRFVAEVVAAQDREARRIAELLHDDAVQQLTALGVRLELHAMNGDETLVELAEETSGIAASLRRLLVELHPAVLESRGVAAAIDAAADTARAQGVAVAVAPFAIRFPAEIEQLAYRLAQEGLSNAAKHAHASAIDVEFAEIDGRLRCQIVDDGRGLDQRLVDNAVSRGHLGLQIVRDRVELAGGRFLLESRPGGGTVFAFELPLQPCTDVESVRAAAAER